VSVAGWIAIATLWVVVACLGVAVLALARQIGILHQRLQPVGALKLGSSLAVGQPAPVVEASDFGGQRLTIGAGDPAAADTLVIFVSPSCPVCKSLLPALRAIRRREKPPIKVILASDGPRLEHADFIAAESLGEFTYVLSEALGIAYGAGRLPHAVLIDGAGIVRASGLVNSREHLDSLFEARERGVASLQEWMAGRGEHRDVA
jgi:methylamine dehydrogenase accessory protein MauD